MRVLVACEYSGIVRDAFLEEGHDAISCDILPTESEGPHWRCDVHDLFPLHNRFDLVVAHPPCTYLANSGVRWRVERQEWREVQKAADFFREFLGCAPFWAIENPVMHRHARLPKPSWTVQPWMFGDNEKKRVCFWTNLPKLKPTSDLNGDTAVAKVHRASPGPDRWKSRSKFFKGMAHAMATQWGPHIEDTLSIRLQAPSCNPDLLAKHGVATSNG